MNIESVLVVRIRQFALGVGYASKGQFASGVGGASEAICSFFAGRLKGRERERKGKRRARVRP